MEKISNKIFIQYVKSFTKKTWHSQEIDLLKNFEINIEKLENLIEKRIINKCESEHEAVYFSINHHIATYVNSTKIKFVDLYKGFINCINSGSFSGALVISRTILENVSMLDYLSTKIIKFFKDKNYIKLIQELLNLSVPSWDTETVKDYKRTHINDALKHFSKSDTGGFGGSEKKIFIIYDPVSEMTHPSATSFLMYESHNNSKKNEITKFQTSFSQNSENIHEKVFPPITLVLMYPYFLVEKLYSKIQKDLIDMIKKSKIEIDTHFKFNPEDAIKYHELIKNLVLKEEV